MNYEPLVTIVIPVYNGTNFMQEAIDCALNQTYKKIEVIVVNDGSNDEGATDRVARSYGNKIRYYCKENGGVSSALNLAIDVMNGKWLSWLSHDDLYYPTKIEKQVLFLNKLLSESPDIDLSKTVIHCATESIDKDGRIIKRPNYRNIPEKENTIDVILDNIYSYRLSGCSFLLPSECFKHVGGFREDIRTVSDVEFWYRLLFSGYQFYCMSNDVLVQNRSHGMQVGKAKVSLFSEELEDLHISISSQLCESTVFNSNRNIKKLYLGLKKRNFRKATAFVMEKYIANKLSWTEVLAVRVEGVYWLFLGATRSIARDFFRMIMVK